MAIRVAQASSSRHTVQEVDFDDEEEVEFENGSVAEDEGGELDDWTIDNFRSRALGGEAAGNLVSAISAEESLMKADVAERSTNYGPSCLNRLARSTTPFPSSAKLQLQ